MQYYKLCQMGKNKIWNTVNQMAQGETMIAAALTLKLGLEYGLGERFLNKELETLEKIAVITFDQERGIIKKL